MIIRYNCKEAKPPKIELSNKSRVTAWEYGGGWSQTGECQIIAGPRGERVKPVTIRYRGHLACDKHALMPITDGYYVVTAKTVDDEVVVGAWKIKQSKTIEVDDEEALSVLREAINTAVQKAQCYHCREPHYAL